MPKRIIDGEGLWRSDKLAKVTPTWIKAEYANLVPLALANGSFEVNPRRIWSTVYSYNRPEITLEQVEEVLAEFERVKLLFRWTDGATSKQWGYFVGIEKPGRLPAPSRLRQGHEILGPQPPRELLQTFLSDPESTGQPVATQTVPNGSIGFGSCFGLGSGRGDGLPMASQETSPVRLQEASEEFNATEVAQILCQQNGWSGNGMIWALQAGIEFQAKRMPKSELRQVGEMLVKAYRDYESAKGAFAVVPQKFFEQGLYCSATRSGESKANVLTDNPATRALAQMEGD